MPQVKLDQADFFRYNSPFRQWLFDSKGKQIGDYHVDEAKTIFTKEFVSLWNNDKLPSKNEILLVKITTHL